MLVLPAPSLDMLAHFLYSQMKDLPPPYMYSTPGGTNGGGSSYHYSNTNGSYYYQNDNGSTYYSSPSGQGTYTAPSGGKN